MPAAASQAYARYKEKRKSRHFGKKIRYQTRKALAEQRPRVRGQFVRVPKEGERGGLMAQRSAWRGHGAPKCASGDRSRGLSGVVESQPTAWAADRVPALLRVPLSATSPPPFAEAASTGDNKAGGAAAAAAAASPGRGAQGGKATSAAAAAVAKAAKAAGEAPAGQDGMPAMPTPESPSPASTADGKRPGAADAGQQVRAAHPCLACWAALPGTDSQLLRR